MSMGHAWSPHSAAADHGNTVLPQLKEFKAHLKEAARAQTPDKFTSAAEEGHFQGLLASQRCRQLARDWTVESPVVGVELPLC